MGRRPSGIRSDHVESPRDCLELNVEQRLSLGGCLHLYDVRHIVIDCGRWRFIRLVDDQLNSGLHHRCRHWVNVHWTPRSCLTAAPNCQALVYGLLRNAVNEPGNRFAQSRRDRRSLPVGLQCPTGSDRIHTSPIQPPFAVGSTARRADCGCRCLSGRELAGI